jgi:hypothetical protein
MISQGNKMQNEVKKWDKNGIKDSIEGYESIKNFIDKIGI